MTDHEYDAICIGSGPGGNAAAQQVALRGGRACLIEREHLGGTCLNVGCMPTKALLASAEAAAVRRSDALGLRPSEPGVDGPAVMGRVHDIVDRLRRAMNDKMDDFHGVEVLRGQAVVADAHTVSVRTDTGRRDLTGRALVLATGARPVRPKSVQWDSPRVHTSSDLLARDDLPESLLIMGGGILGCEFGCAMGELGVRVVLLEMADRLLSMLAPAAGEAAADLLADRGVETVCGAEVVAITDTGGAARAELADGRSFLGEACLVAVGRRANVEDVGLEAVGLEVQEGVLSVDDRCRTGVEGVYAVGDVAERRQYAHLASRMGEVAGDNIMGVESADDRTVVPNPVFTHPNIATVGLTEKQARDRYRQPVVLTYDYASSGTALLYDRRLGQVTVIAEPERGRIVGGLWISPHACEHIHQIAAAVRNERTLDDLYRTIHAHPSYSEGLRGAIEEHLMG